MGTMGTVRAMGSKDYGVYGDNVIAVDTPTLPELDVDMGTIGTVGAMWAMGLWAPGYYTDLTLLTK